MGMQFHAITFEDRKDIEDILRTQNTDSFSRVFGSYFLWADVHKTKVCVNDGVLYIKYDLDTPKYEMPKGFKNDSELKHALRFLLEDARNSGVKSGLKLTRLLSDEAKELEKLFPRKFEITAARDDFEYVYLANDLADLKGKRYHSKRNHISKFTKKYNWEYRMLEISEKEKYKLFFDKWFKEKVNADPKELLALRRVLNFYEPLEMVGGAIFVDDEIIACTIGEKINEDTFVVHFEKALLQFAEAYAVINNQFCKYMVKNGYKFVNREEDLGIPGLRKAKLSYHPYKMVEKYDAVIKEF